MRDGSKSAPDPAVEPTPNYLRFRFVVGAVLFAVLLGFGIHAWGTSGDIELGTGAVVVAPEPVAEANPAGPTEPGDRADCPAPGEPVELAAAELIAFFGAAAADPALSDLPAKAEVLTQLEATAPAPAVMRMTRVGGFIGSSGSWSSCVISTWIGPKGPLESLDVVTVSLVRAKDRSDATTGSGSRRRPTPETDRWEVTAWLRGVPEEPGPTRASTLEFFDSSESCRRPDRPVSVPVADGEPSQRLRAVLEELISGPTGRSPTASSNIPADVQVLDAQVAGSEAIIVLTPTLDDGLSRCAGTGAYEQIRDTAEAVVAETRTDEPPGGEEADPSVEVVIDGEQVETLRP